MKVQVESYNESVDVSIRERIVSDVTFSLMALSTVGDEFIVNDTPWFWRNPAGKIRPSVANSAHYISKGFQNALVRYGWTKEPTLAGQTFDAMISFDTQSKCYQLAEDAYLGALAMMRDGGFEDYGFEATSIYRRYVQSTVPFLPATLMPFSNLFTCIERDYHFRIGLEFETGNIASSFRAIEKLQGLFDNREIDIGVFITSQSKQDGAARIWPVSNRNGSFEELRQRRYDARRNYPHIDISFCPDRYDRQAKYLADNHLYEMRFSGEKITIGGKTYEWAVNSKGEEKLCLQSVATLP